ncbi:hypothetical protein D3C80_1894770 [compost metagenome]
MIAMLATAKIINVVIEYCIIMDPYINLSINGTISIKATAPIKPINTPKIPIKVDSVTSIFLS